MNNQNNPIEQSSLLATPVTYYFKDATAGASMVFNIEVKQEAKLLSVNVSCGCLSPKIVGNLAHITFKIPNTKGSEFIRNLKVFTDKGEESVTLKGNVKANA